MANPAQVPESQWFPADRGTREESAPNQNVGGACCDGSMTKRHHRGRQGSRRSLTPIPTPDPQADPQKISNRYTEEVRWEILLLEPVNDWFVALCKQDPQSQGTSPAGGRCQRGTPAVRARRRPRGDHPGRRGQGGTLERVVCGSDPARGGTLCVVPTRDGEKEQ